MMTSSLPAPVAALVEGALGAAITGLAPTLGGFSNLSRRAMIGGRACVIKAAQLPAKRADLRHEASVLRLLPAMGMPAPPMLALADDHAWTALVMAELPGRPGVALLEGDPAELPAAFAALGGMLSRLHAAPAPEAPALALALRLAAAHAALGAPDLGDDLRGPLATALSHPAWAAGPPRLIHGDAGMHNLLWDVACCVPTASLIDWEWAAVGPPALDLAWLRWTMRWRGLPEGLWRIALEAYALPVPSADLLDFLALAQIAMILARVVEQPAARAEWLRRARWTMR